MADRLSEFRDVTVVPNKEHSDRVVRLLLNLANTWNLYAIAKRAENHVTLFAQRGTKSRTRVVLVLIWRQLTGSKLMFDFDDAIFLQSPWGTQQLCRASDAVLAANEYLAQYARQYSDHVTVVPTSIDLRVYQRRASPSVARDVPVIGWIGTSWNVGYLRSLVKPLLRLNASNDFLLTLVTDPLEANRLRLPSDIPLRVIPWRLGDFVTNLSTFDIGVCPLPDNPFTRGKSGYKVLEYMALGIPAVASPVGGIIGLVDDGIDGLLAASDDEWYRHLRDLVESPAQRQAIGLAGKRKVEDYYSLDKIAKDVEKLVGDLEQK